MSSALSEPAVAKLEPFKVTQMEPTQLDDAASLSSSSLSSEESFERHDALYDELESDDSDAGSPFSGSSPRRRRHRHHAPTSTRMQRSDFISYFHPDNTRGFSLRNEWNCFADHVTCMWTGIEEERLPWLTDFADPQKMRFPRKVKEVVGRLNLNIPYYSSNYLEIFYCVTLPFLFIYNLPFCIVVLVSSLLAHSIAVRKREQLRYGASTRILGKSISYHMLGHILLGSTIVLFVFFDGMKTTLWVLVVNALIVIPHALWRKPTYFDDEELEKCRPKLVQYVLVLLFMALSYLEGGQEDEMPDGSSFLRDDSLTLAADGL